MILPNLIGLQYSVTNPGPTVISWSKLCFVKPYEFVRLDVAEISVEESERIEFANVYA